MVIRVFLVVILVFFSFPFLGGVILLNNGRLEDHLALQQLGIHLPPQTPLDLHWFLNVTGLWLATFITALNFINLKVEDPAREPVTYYHIGKGPINIAIVYAVKRMYPYPMSGRWSWQKTGDHTYRIVCDDRKYRPRYSMLVVMAFMPEAIGLIAVLRELFNLANNMISKRL